MDIEEAASYGVLDQPSFDMIKGYWDIPPIGVQPSSVFRQEVSRDVSDYL